VSVTVQWDDAERTTLLYTYEGRWSWAEYEEAVIEAVNLVGKDRQTVNVIADFSEGSLLPEQALSNFRRSLNREDRSVSFGLAVLIIRNEFMIRMLDLFVRLYGRGGIGARLKPARSLEEARQIIYSQRERKESLV